MEDFGHLRTFQNLWRLQQDSTREPICSKERQRWLKILGDVVVAVFPSQSSEVFSKVTQGSQTFAELLKTTISLDGIASFYCTHPESKIYVDTIALSPFYQFPVA